MIIITPSKNKVNIKKIYAAAIMLRQACIIFMT